MTLKIDLVVSMFSNVLALVAFAITWRTAAAWRKLAQELAEVAGLTEGRS
jgi:hypothetical protein